MSTFLDMAFFDINIRQPKPGGDLKMAFAASAEGRPCMVMELDHALARIKCTQTYQAKDYVCFVNLSHVSAYVESALPETSSVPDVSLKAKK